MSIQIPIWPGSSSFSASATPFGFFDTDTTFQSHADKVSSWCATRLGYPLNDIELQSIHLYACFEESVLEYSNQVNQFSIRDNMFILQGTPTGSNLTKGATELELTIGKLHYQNPQHHLFGSVIRQGTASQFLARNNGGKIAIRIVPSPGFHLPHDLTRPVVMFAGGTGISPCRSFWLERTKHSHKVENWLFFSTATREDFYYQQELTELMATGKLQLRVVFSRENIRAIFRANGEEGNWEFIPTNAHRITDEIQQTETKQLLWQLLRDIKDGGKGAYIYLCGTTGFANTIKES